MWQNILFYDLGIRFLINNKEYNRIRTISQKCLPEDSKKK